jgi:hypothetical protein
MHIPARRERVFAFLVLFTICPRLTSQDRTEGILSHLDVTPLVSYRSSMSLAIQPLVPGTNPRVVLNSSPSYGLAVGVRIREGDLMELRWSRQDSQAEIQGGGIVISRSRMISNQFHCDFSHEYAIKHPTPWLRPFIVASVGATNFSSDVNSGSTYLSAGFGGGVKMFVSRHLGFRIQAEWLPAFVDTHGTAVCGSGCVVHFGGTLGSQAEIAVGPVFRFWP